MAKKLNQNFPKKNTLILIFNRINANIKLKFAANGNEKLRCRFFSFDFPEKLISYRKRLIYA